MVALLGPSGCGKTTTLRMVAGLVEPTEGDVLIGGNARHPNAGASSQYRHAVPELCVGSPSIGGGERGVRASDARASASPRSGPRSRTALALVQLSALADRLPAALSGGQQQRVALARAIVIEPTLLLLDEPLGALDRNLRESMQVEIRQIQKRLGITAVMVTHDQERRSPWPTAS